ncbi:hypothetical protein ACQCX5_03415 [Propionibacteriaceae bacterium G57]|uniref:hypothetical protein n=1 Tax=Aestuariimicrobium sp. G57 TaxID=3418485 RepID=UPI003DA6F2F7
MEVFLAIVAVLVVVGGGIAIAVHHQRQKYIASLTARGWTFIDRPDETAVCGLNCPPFGMGVNRRVDDQIVGHTSTGAAFQAFEYDASTHRRAGYIAAVRLPRSLPEFYLLPHTAPRPGVAGVVVTQQGTHHVVAKDPDYAHKVLAAIVGTLGRYPAPPDLSIDHDQLVAVGAPKEAEALAAYLEALSATARAIADAGALSSYLGPTPPPRLSLYERPDWEFRNRDDGMLAEVAYSGGGFDHTAEEVILSQHPQLPFVSLLHRWKTQRTETYTDGQGNTRTRTVTDHHSERLLEYHPRFSFPDFKVNRGLMGNKVTFEWHEFNEAFTVRCRSPRLASDIFHPRMMEYLMERRPPGFEVDERGAISISLKADDVASLMWGEDFLLGFFARVPNFVWENLGYQRPPVPPRQVSRG